MQTYNQLSDAFNNKANDVFYKNVVQQSTTSPNCCATVLRFCNIVFQKTKRNNDFTKLPCDSSTFLKHCVPENKAKQRFQQIAVRQFYIFATLCSRKQSETTLSIKNVRQFYDFENPRPKTHDSSTFLLHPTKWSQEEEKSFPNTAPAQRNSISRRYQSVPERPQVR